MPSDTPRPDVPLEAQLRALGERLDAAAPPVSPGELADATPTEEVAHLVAIDPDGTDVIPLVPVPPMVDLAPPGRRRGRVLGVAAAVALLAVGGAAVALSPGDDEVRTDGPVALQPASEGAAGAEGPGVDLGGFGEVAEAFAACMEAAGYPVPTPDGDPGTHPGFGAGSAEEAMAEFIDPDFLAVLRQCTASSGLADLDIAGELEQLDVEGMFEEHFGPDFENPVPGLFDDVVTHLGNIDMDEVAEQFDAWMAELQVELEQAGVRDHFVEAGARADRIFACMEARGYAPPDLSEVSDELPDGETIEQFLADLRDCADQG